MTAEASLPTESITIHDDESALGAVLLRVRLLAQRRLQWLASSLDPTGGGEIEALMADRDDPAAEAEWQRGQASLNAWIAAVEAALAADTDSRLAQLAQVFALDEFGRDLLHVCLAAALDPALGRLYAYCHDDAQRAYPTLALVARLCGYGRFATWGSISPLKRWEMVRLAPDETGDQLAALMLDPAIRDWLSGSDEPDPLLIGRARMIPLLEPLAEWDVAAAATFAADALGDDPSRTVAIQVIAPAGSGRKTFAACVAAQLGMRLLAIEAAAITDDEWERVFIHAQRQAFLQGVALAWSIDGGEHVSARRWSQSIAHFPVQFILRDLSSAAPVVPGAIVLRVDLPAPGVATRSRLWQQYAAQAAATSADQLSGLAERFNARPGAIVAAAGVPGASVEGMARALRDSQRDLLGGLAQPLDSQFDWDDLVVTDMLREALRDFVHEAKDRALFWEQPEARRLFPQGRGLAALFTGSPGTGKTMAAQVMAAQLGLDLFRIDLSTVVSKYVGETSHNLQRILSRAADMDVVLFFDEADALFSRRTEVKDAHDRFANTDTNHLLQALESYGGIAILATNRKANIDPAFIRRLRYVLEFSRPDAAQRRQLWTRLIGALAGADAADGLRELIERLAAELELTGAQIKYAVLTGVFAARRDRTAMEAKHLLRGLDREMAKEGRALSDRERARLG
ncbi:MAG: ATP-binding protein [Chloroflexi bacterium]|nr:ATP-binding protein [Chloroflexota bacterium]